MLVVNEAIGIFVRTVIVIDHEFRIVVAIEIEPVDKFQLTFWRDEQILARIAELALRKFFKSGVTEEGLGCCEPGDRRKKHDPEAGQGQ